MTARNSDKSPAHQARPESKVRPEEEPSPEPAGYFKRSRCLATSFLFILPLILLYEIGLFHVGPKAGSPAAGALKAPLFVLEHHAAMVFYFLVAAGAVVAVVWLVRRRELRPVTFLPMLIESMLYAALLGPLIWLVLQRKLVLPSTHFSEGDLPARIVAAAGAGVYEEVLFRGILLGSLYYVGTRVMEIKPLLSAAVSVLVAAAIFSLMHLVPAAEPINREFFLFRGSMFLFRLVAGLILSAVYLARGLGIACWTHVLYNVLVLPPE